jgi:hypothetical protein
MINNILKKIEKANEVQNVELEKHEVELALVDDLALLNKKAKDYRETINFLYDTRVKLNEYAKKNRVALNNYLTQLGDSRDKILISAKELGLDPRNIGEYKNSLAHTEEIKNVVKIYDDFLTSGKL